MGYDYYYTDDVEREIKNMESGNGRPANYGIAVASLVMGIVSLVFFLFLLNIVTAIIAIVFGIIFLGSSNSGEKGRGCAAAGIAASILSIVLCIGSYIIIFQNSDNISNMMENELRNNNSQFHYYEDFNGDDPFSDIEDFYQFYENNQNPEDLFDNGDDTL